MPKKTQSVVIVPNLSGEVFDVVGTSVSENYVMTTVAGLSNPTTTDWTSYLNNDQSNQTVSSTLNVKTFTTRYTGIPNAVAKIARNISVMTGPSVPGIDPDYMTTWAVIHKDSTTKFRRLSDNVEYDAAVLDPTNAATWNQWQARLKGQFDSSGKAVGAYESSLTQISAFKFSLGGATSFNGFSPIMVNSGEFIKSELFTQTNNIVYYTKDTTGASSRTSRRGNVVYCRVEQNSPGYSVEYPICSCPSPIISIEHVWAYGSAYYLIVLTEAGYITFVSSPYSRPIEEESRADFLAQSILYTQVVSSYTLPTESGQANFSTQSVNYISVVVTNSPPTESGQANFSTQSVAYVAVVVTGNIPTEGSVSDFSANLVDYIYSPATPTVPPAHFFTIVTEGIESTISAQSITYA